MDIIQYLLSIIQYLYQQNCWLINFICRYIPLKREFDSSIIKKTFAGRINPVLFLSIFSFLYMLFYVIV